MRWGRISRNERRSDGDEDWEKRWRKLRDRGAGEMEDRGESFLGWKGENSIHGNKASNAIYHSMEQHQQSKNHPSSKTDPQNQDLQPKTHLTFLETSVKSSRCIIARAPV